MGDESDRSRGLDSALPSVASHEAINVLLLGSPMDSRTLDAGLSLLTGDDPGETRVLWVTFLNTPQEVVDIWDDHCSVRPDELRIVLVGDGLSVADTVTTSRVAVDTVTDPADLTTLGIRLLSGLSALSEGTDGDVDIRLRFDSLTPLFQYVSRQALSRFLHVLTTCLADAGVRAHFHLDPLAHDSQLVHTLASICDARVRVDEDGVTVTRR